LHELLRQKTTNKKNIISLYYPSNYELNTMKLFEIFSKKNITTLLPVVSKKNMNFYKWKYKDPLKVNQFGMLEPLLEKKKLIPNVIVTPLLAFNKINHRLGYGKGYYDKFLNKYLKSNREILTIGVAFSFQKFNKLPISNFDVKLDFILTEKGFN